MQDSLMLILEVVVLLLLVLELYIRFAGMRKDRQLQDQQRAADQETAREEQPAVQPVVAQPPVAPQETAHSQVVEEGLSSEDLLREAEIYLQYGHYTQAATVLRWYVDLHPNDGRVINQLLDAYLAQEDIDAYSELLGSLGETLPDPGDRDWWARRVGEGLQRDPGNLELLVMAEKMHIPIPQPSSETQEPMTAAKALALVARNPDPQYDIAILRSAIQEQPLHVSLYAELLRITHKQKDIDGFVDALILMNLAIRPGGGAICERMLSAGRNLGPHPYWERIQSDSQNPQALRQLAEERHLAVSPKLPE